MRKIYILIVLLCTLNVVDAQQFSFMGIAAQQGTGCYKITDSISQFGSIWKVNQINLTQPFEVYLTLNFGIRPGNIGNAPTTCGADGMSFVMYSGNAVNFSNPGGIGFHGITPSLGVIMDAHNSDTTDPAFNHISINKNGDELHGTSNELVPYTAAVNFPANITDSLDHLIRIKYMPGLAGSGTLQIYFGTANTLPTTPTISYTGNIINSIFNGSANVNWAINGSTGSCWNKQKVCVTNMASFDRSTPNCVGIPIAFTDNSISESSIINRKWNFGDGDTSILQNPTHTFANSGIYNVTLTVVDAAGYSATTSNPIVIFAKPPVSVNNATICKGDSASLIATGASTYTWSNSPLTSYIHKVTPIVNTSYIVTGVDAFGCINKDTAFVTIAPDPILTITVDKDTICSNDSALITVNGANTYLWNDGFTGNSHYVSSISFGMTTTEQYHIIGISNQGCKAFKDVYITVLQALQISFSNSPPIPDGCSPFTVTFINESDPPLLYHFWDFGDGTTDTVQNPTHTYQVGTYSVKLKGTEMYGCTDSVKLINLIRSNPIPIADFAWSPVNVTTQNPVSFINLTTPANSNYTYNWNYGDGSINDLTDNPTHIYNNNGTFNVILISISDHGCSDTVTHTISVSTGIEEVKENTFSIYPNPVDDQFTIEYYANEPIKLILTNELGKELETIVLNDNSGSKQIYVFDMSAYTKGIYFIKLQRKESSISRKIVKAK